MYNDQLYNSRVYKCALTTHFYAHNSMYAHVDYFVWCRSVRNIYLLSSMHRYCFANDCRFYHPFILRHLYSHTLDTFHGVQNGILHVADLAARGMHCK